MDISQQINKAKQYKTIIAIFSLLGLARLIYIFLPHKMSWDASVYMGMGEFLASLGKTGAWEYFRPPVLPILLAAGDVLGVPIILWAQILTFLASMGSIYLIYKIGEKIRPFAGIFASIVLGVSTIFFAFTNTAMTEVFGVFFSLLVLYFLYVREKHFLAGIFAGLCFLTRFPYGLLLPIFFLSYAVFDWRSKELWREAVRRVFIFSAGFLATAFIYLASNYFFYGSFLSPLLGALQAAGGSPWIYSHSATFYQHVLLAENPLFLFSILTICMALSTKYFSDRRYMIFLLVLWITFFLEYFMHQPNKQARFIITVFPALSLLSGMYLSYLFERWRSVAYKKYFLCALILGFAIITFSNTSFFTDSQESSESFQKFYSILRKEQGKTVITSSPMVVAYSPVKIIPAYDRWEFFMNIYKQNRLQGDFLLIDSCELYVCPPGEEIMCENYKKEVLNMVYANEQIIYDGMAGSCHQIVAKIKR